MSSTIDPTTEENVGLLMSERSCTVATLAYMQLPLDSGPGRRPRPFADRREGVPCKQVRCPYSYVAAPLLAKPSDRDRVARRQAQGKGLTMRYFVDLALRKAVTVDCTDLRHLDERALRDNEPGAIAYLRALRDAGTDVIWIRGSSSPRVAVVFTGSVGSTIEVVDEASYALTGTGSWWRLSPPSEKPDAGKHATGVQRRLRFPRGSAPRLSGWWLSLRSHMTLTVRELIVALLLALAAPSVVHHLGGILGFDVTLPLWVMLLAAAPAGWLVARALCKGVKPPIQQIRRVSDDLSRLSALANELGGVGETVGERGCAHR